MLNLVNTYTKNKRNRCNTRTYTTQVLAGRHCSRTRSDKNQIWRFGWVRCGRTLEVTGLKLGGLDGLEDSGSSVGRYRRVRCSRTRSNGAQTWWFGSSRWSTLAKI